MATAVYTSSMQAHAEVLVERSHRWARGVDHTTGHRFVTFVSSRTTAEGEPIYHKTRGDGLGCTCESWLFRGACSHALACQWDTERQVHDLEVEAAFASVSASAGARQTAAKRVYSRGYADLFGPDND